MYSHNKSIHSKFIMPSPAWANLTGFIVGSWVADIEEADIVKIGPKLSVPEMVEVLTLIRTAAAANRRSAEA